MPRNQGQQEDDKYFDPSLNTFPVWSPDGGKVAYASTRGGGGILNQYLRAFGGAGQDELLLESKTVKNPEDWSKTES